MLKAQELLILEYINKFGPATIKDLVWWSGLSVNKIKSIINCHKDTITKFRAEDFNSEFYISIMEYEKLNNYKLYDAEWVTLLAYEDPSLKGYYESRT